MDLSLGLLRQLLEKDNTAKGTVSERCFYDEA